MPEDMNLEIAAALSEREEREASEKRRWEELVEIVEVAILALVAVATARKRVPGGQVGRPAGVPVRDVVASAFRGGSRRNPGCGAATSGHHHVQHVDPSAPTG
jgi:hypothetical protein